MRIRGVSLYLLLLSCCTPLAAAEILTLQSALDAVDQQHPAVRHANDQLIPFIQREAELCHQRMATQLTFAPPTLSCTTDIFLTPVQRQQLLVLRRMLDVSLADSRAGYENEALATAFIDFDRTQTRMEQGQKSELDVSQYQAAYQPVRVRFSASEKAQRLSRAMLALARRTPEELISDIELPAFSQWVERLPDDEKAVIKKVLESNKILEKIDKADEDNLYKVVRNQLYFTTLELMQALEVMKIEREAADADFDYRSLYLDKSRTLYELEVKADLGDSMVNQTGARQRQDEVLYQRVMLKATLNALLGLPLMDGLSVKQE